MKMKQNVPPIRMEIWY